MQGLGRRCSVLSASGMVSIRQPGSQAVDQVAHQSQDLGLCAQAARLLIRVRTHPGFQVWVPRRLIRVRTDLRALGRCARAARPLIRVHTHQASGVCWGYLSSVHNLGAEEVGAQEAIAAEENSLNSC